MAQSSGPRRSTHGIQATGVARAHQRPWQISKFVTLIPLTFRARSVWGRAMSLFASVSVVEIKARGSIKDADVARLRGNFANGGSITAEEADQLISLNDACPIKDPAWQNCFVDLLTDYIVEQCEPSGYMNAGKAGWVRDRLSRFGKIEVHAKLDLLVNIIARSRWVPQSLVSFALDQVRLAILDGSGPLRAGKPFEPGAVADGDVILMRRILLSFGGEGNEGITRMEAEILLSIDIMTQSAVNCPGWRDLFVGALACAAMAASGYRVPPREVALAPDTWSERRDLDNILSGMVCGDGTLLCNFKPLDREALAIQRLTQQKIGIVTREDVPAYDAGWLVQHLAVASHLTPNVMAFLRLLKAEGRPVDARLQGVLDLVSAAAA